MRRILPALGIVSTLLPHMAKAGGPLGRQGDPLTTSAYALDLAQGPVLAGSRVTGLAGAYAPIADGAEGDLFHPASPAVRVPWSRTKFDYDLNVGLTFPSALSRTDFDNNGSVGFSERNFVFLTLGGNVQYGPFGAGFSINAQTYSLAGTTYPSLSITMIQPKILFGWAFLRDQFVVGAGVRSANFSLSERLTSRTLLSISGAGVEIGGIFAPHDFPWRASLAVRSPVTGRVRASDEALFNGQGDLLIDGKFMPRDVSLPGEIEAGIAWQFGTRPLNPGWVDQSEVSQKEIGAAFAEGVAETPREVARRIARAWYRKLPRKKWLVVGSVLATAPTANGEGIEGYVRQTVDRSGADWTFSPRLGVETEPWAGELQLRGGSYVEPTRFSYSSARVHGTLGFDLPVLYWTVFGLFEEGTAWRISGALDGSRQYLSWGLSIGNWH